MPNGVAIMVPVERIIKKGRKRERRERENERKRKEEEKKKVNYLKAFNASPTLNMVSHEIW
jgi:hypothetical protein